MRQAQTRNAGARRPLTMRALRWLILGGMAVAVSSLLGSAVAQAQRKPAVEVDLSVLNDSASRAGRATARPAPRSAARPAPRRQTAEHVAKTPAKRATQSARAPAKRATQTAQARPARPTPPQRSVAQARQLPSQRVAA